jgi:DNA-binding transcriptional regulator YiaG
VDFRKLSIRRYLTNNLKIITFSLLTNHIPMVYIRIMTSIELKKWREVHGYSQAKLARALNVATMTVSRWETDLRGIPTFLHLALRCLELEGGESIKGKSKRKGERNNER